MASASTLVQTFGTHGDALVLYARQWLDRAAAEDVVQEVFTHLLERRRHDASPALVYASVRNAAISVARSSQARRRRERAVAGHESALFDSPDDRLDARHAADALATLPPMQREAVVLRIWGQLGFEAIAEILGCSVSTAHGHFRSALIALRHQLERPCPNPPPTRS
jgi:RNA polymerase sigma factor (sigma-70 family)